MPNFMFKVELVSGDNILCHVSGKQRAILGQLLAGDKVKVEISPFDNTRGRIIRRNK